MTIANSRIMGRATADPYIRNVIISLIPADSNTNMAKATRALETRSPSLVAKYSRNKIIMNIKTLLDLFEFFRHPFNHVSYALLRYRDFVRGMKLVTPHLVMYQIPFGSP